MSGAGTIWMPLYVRDYIADTQDLTMEQSGAYLQLLMVSWLGGPLPDDDKRLATFCRVTLGRWMRAIKPAVMAKFRLTEDGFVQKRLEFEREKAVQRATKNASNGKLGGRPKPLESQENGKANGYPNANPIESPSPSPSPSQVEKEEVSLPSEAPASAVAVPAKPARLVQPKSDPDFEEFWRHYPRKVGIGAARAAYAKAKRKASSAVIMRGLAETAWNADQQFNPHPATWLNQERWVVSEDEVPEGLRMRRSASGGGKLAWMKNDRDDLRIVPATMFGD